MSLTGFFFLFVGVYLVLLGLKARRLIDESEFPATAEERMRADHPSSLERLLVVIAGIASFGYGLYKMVGKQ